MPSVRVDATPLRRPAGPARYAMSRTVVTPSGSRRTRRVTPLARGEVYLVEGRSHLPPSAPPLCAPRELWPRQLLAKGGRGATLEGSVRRSRRNTRPPPETQALFGSCLTGCIGMWVDLRCSVLYPAIARRKRLHAGGDSTTQ